MATELIFRDDPYARSCKATVSAIGEDGIELDRTVFYPTGGGQPGDSGRLVLDGAEIPLTDTIKGEGPAGVLHIPAAGADTAALVVGASVSAEIDWPRRYRLMRMHTSLHLLSAVLPYPVTGGAVGDGKGRLDLHIPESILDKETITAELGRLIAANHPVSGEWIDAEQLAAKPELVKTLSVKPPMASGRVRLIRIEGLDLQACGGTHVANTGEIGVVLVRKIEKKGRLNRRVSLTFITE